MNTLKRVLGVVWVLVGLYAGYYLVINQAVPLWKSGGNDLVPAIIYSFVLAPIITLGMFVFGIYAIQGEFSSKE